MLHFCNLKSINAYRIIELSDHSIVKLPPIGEYSAKKFIKYFVSGIFLGAIASLGWGYECKWESISHFHGKMLSYLLDF